MISCLEPRSRPRQRQKGGGGGRDMSRAGGSVQKKKKKKEVAGPFSSPWLGAAAATSESKRGSILFLLLFPFFVAYRRSHTSSLERTKTKEKRERTRPPNAAHAHRGLPPCGPQVSLHLALCPSVQEHAAREGHETGLRDRDSCCLSLCRSKRNGATHLFSAALV